jgi:hypothetical protein
MKRNSRGVALLMVLGALALLALTATVFATLAGTERRISRNYLDQVRARLISQSGVEAALALLQERLSRGTLWTETSWTVAAGRKIRVDGKEIGDAGFMGGGAYGTDGDFYTVRIDDAHSRINVNDGAPGGPEHSVSRNLRRILNILGAQPSVNVPGLGDKILRSRPLTGYASPFDLLGALGGDREGFERARRFVTLRSWSDPGVANPVPLSAETLHAYAIDFPRPTAGSGPIFRYGHQKNSDGEPIRAPLLFFDPAHPDPTHHAIWGRDSLNPQWIEIVSRSPVNINTAPREVLMALLIDLEGFFLAERRRDLSLSGRGAVSPCGSPGGGYSWTSLRYSYDGRGNEGDECGFLYRTVPFVGPGGRSAAGIPAAAVVQEILACRERRSSPTLDYAKVPFGGPFGSWSQFNLFVDALADGGLFGEGRASGDVLKANFNPNRNLFTHVDKTDLLVHSIEFCFTPMGAFEIESTGRVVAPLGNGDHEMLAVQKSSVTVKLFDAVRETSQQQFYAGTFSKRRAGPETNNNFGMECGPEPDNGPAPSENRYEGYLQLSTIGSNLTKTAQKPRQELWTTLTDPSFYPGALPMPSGGAHLGSVIHAHFQLDHAAHHHASRSGFTSPPFWDGFRVPQGGWQTVFGRRCCLNRNWEDRTETLPSPYSPADGPRAGRDFRIARSFTGPPPPGSETAPSDLRLDGAYIERDSAFGYWIDENVSFNFNEGAVGFWMKPAFFPEATVKRRTLLSMSRYHARAPALMNPSPFALFFIPPQGGDETATPSYTAGVKKMRPSSLAFGLGFSAATGYNGEMTGRDDPDDKATHHAFVFSPTLNHEGHGDGRSSLLRAHEWIHVGVTWANPRETLPTSETVRILINGRILPDTVGMAHLFQAEGQPFKKTPWWSVHSLQASLPGLVRSAWVKNSIRLGGEPSRLFDLPGNGAAFPANFTADATFDEFYVWTDREAYYNGGLWGLQQLWNRGRYYRPDDRDPNDARFTSALIDLSIPARRAPAPAATLPDPSGIPLSTPVKEDPPRRRLLGVSWTEIAGDLTTGSVAELAVEADGAWHSPYRDPVFSPSRDSSGAPLLIDDPSKIRYAVKLKRPVAPSLSTPVVDDVTLFFDGGAPEILGWVAS